MPRPWPVVAACLSLAAVTTAGVATAATAHEASAARPPTAVAPVTEPVAAHSDVVLPLGRLTPPDGLAALSHPVTATELRHLRARRGVQAVAVLDRGTVRVDGQRLVAVGVDPSEIRGFTPSLTARSDELWQSIARGDMALSYAAAPGLRRQLGNSIPVRGHGAATQQVRLGAFAAMGLPAAQVVVDRTDAQLLALRSARNILIAAPHRSTGSLETMLRRVIRGPVRIKSLRPEKPARPAMSDYARATIPADYLARYQAASTTCAGLPWTVLAAIGAVETWHGTNVHRSSKGAEGPMQFLPSTFTTYGVDADGDGVADINDPDDAVYSAARYLCLWGAGRGGQALYDAVFAYNHADWYVRRVFAFANAYV